MKKNILMATLAIAFSFGVASCKKKVSDTDLQNQAITVITSNPSASVEVREGEAHLSGTFTDLASKDAVIAQLKAIKGIKNVHDMTSIEIAAAPIETQSAVSPEIQQKVKDALKDFPTVKVEAVHGELSLSGTATQAQARKIKESIDALKIGKYTNNITVK